jgi:ubiquinol-cytochrome c reductase cytochrome b subunit
MADVAVRPPGAGTKSGGARGALQRRRRPGAAEVTDRLYGWLDDRLGISQSGRSLVNKIFPDHWSFMLGEIALYSFVVLLATGVFLTLYFVPSVADVVYHGSYKPLDGQHVSEAYLSTVNLSFDVRFGLVMRQMHHWAANIFVGSIAVHMARIFFTGAFRRPREINYMIGVTLLILAIFNGFIGYSLPDDLISGTGLRIAFSILLSVPFVGSYLAFWLFGGNYPGTAIIPRFFIIHVLILPAIIAGLIGAHLALIVRQKHTHFRAKGARNDNVIGSPLWPTFFAKTNGFLFLVTGITGLLGAFVQINPIWQFGQYVPYKVSYAVQPDWYMGWLDGALRIMPSWEIVFPGHMVPNPFFPGVLLPGITFGLFYAWPLLEEKLTKDHAEHHILDRPRDRPLRTSIGAAVLAFYFMLFAASSTDVVANYLTLSLNYVLWFFRIATFVVPLVVAPLTYKICRELQAVPGSGKRKRANVVLRSSAGGYATVPVEVRPGDEHVVHDPVDLEDLELATVGSGTGTGVASSGGFTGAGDGQVRGDGSSSDGGAGAGEDGEGVFRIPRQYR